ncbi:MAG: translocation/assembly module TamB domain-containing protein [Lentilitoribacter sp.]
MKRSFLKKIALSAFALIATLFVGIIVVFSQDNERSALIEYVEEQISSPSFQIRLNGIEGSLSSDVKLQSITIADEEGIWLEITNPRLVWTRSALITGRLLVDTLEAEHIDFIRKPLPEEASRSPESSAFQIPELPVAVVLEKLDLPLVEFGKDVFDLAAKASVEGRFVLDEGSLDLDLLINRTDETQGELKANVKYAGSAKTLALDIELSEPENGILASAIGLPGKPPLALSVIGDAPISDLDVGMTFDVDSKRILNGIVSLRDNENGLKANASISGPLGELLPPGQRALFGEKSDIDAELVVLNSGGIQLNRVNISSGAVNLAASAKTTVDGFLSAFKVKGGLTSVTGERIVIPSEARDQTIQSATIDINYDAALQNTWGGTVKISDFVNSDISFGTIGIDAFGTVLNLDNKNAREISFDINGQVAQIWAKDEAVTQALGREINLQFDGDWRSGNPLGISRLNLLGETYRVLANGTYGANAFDGQISVEAENLDSFSAISNQRLNGNIVLAAMGRIQPFSGAFDLDINGKAQTVETGTARLDKLLVGETELSGGIARSVDGLVFNTLKLNNEQMSAIINGQIASETASLIASAQIDNLRALDDASNGLAQLKISLKGEQTPFDLSAEISVPSGQLSSQKVDDLGLTFKGQTDGQTIAGKLSSSGQIEAQDFIVQGTISIDDQLTNLQDLSTQIGATAINGALVRDNETGLMNGELDINSGNISSIAALALFDASGSVNGSIKLVPEELAQTAKLKLALAGIKINDVSIDDAEAIINAKDILMQPRINANAKAIGIKASGINAKSASVQILNAGASTEFDLVAELVENATRVSTSGVVEQKTDLVEVLISELDLKSRVANAQLVSLSTIELQDGLVTINPSRLSIESGTIDIAGTAGEVLNITARASSVPIKIINSVQPGMDASGTLGANIQITGPSSSPRIGFDVNGQALTIRQIRDLGLSPLTLSANGTFENGVVALAGFNTQNAQSLAISGSGNVPISGGSMNVNVNGTAPLDLIETYLQDRGTRIDGVAQLTARISGALSNPVASGNINVDGASVVDPLSNLQLSGVKVRVGLNNSNQANVAVNANISTGGTIALNGQIGLSGNLPADLKVALNSANYGDGETFKTSVSGDLAILGDLAGSPLLSGNINLGRTEITVPESFASEANLLDVEHQNPTSKVQTTLGRLQQATPSDGTNDKSGALRLRLNINAPNQIFVRGRGLDAELGGSLILTGSLDNIVPLGSFTLRRGRLSILGQRIDLEEGTITLAGDLEPLLDFLATTDTGDTIASISLQGTPSNLQVSFSSNPELPEDEVLAQIIFGRNLTDLSPAQVVRLASIASELTGGNSPSLIDSLRSSTGLDDVDVVQDDDGNAAVKAGKYISDNVYLGVQAGKETEATINLDITDSLTATGSVDTEGNSKLGIFFEKDY